MHHEAMIIIEQRAQFAAAVHSRGRLSRRLSRVPRTSHRPPDAELIAMPISSYFKSTQPFEVEVYLEMEAKQPGGTPQLGRSGFGIVG